MSDAGKAIETESVASTDRDMPADSGESAHEALLRRHGLITHIAVLPEGTSGADIACFQADAARRARNLIVLGPRRFGVSLDNGAPPLSSIAHTLMPGQPEEIGRKVNVAADGPDGSAGPMEAENTGPSSNDPKPGSQSSPDTAALPASGPAAAAHTNAAEPNGSAGPMLELLAARLDGLEDRLGGFDSQLLVAHALPALDDLISSRFDTLEGNLIARLAPRQDAADALPEARIAAFWDGLEQALRLLHGQIGDLGTLADRMSAHDPRDLKPALDELEQTVALGFEAAGEAREAHQTALDARIQELDDGTRTALASIDDAVFRLTERTSAMGEAIAGQQGRSDRDAELVGSIDGLGEGIASLIDERLPMGNAEAIAARLDRLGEQMQKAMDASARIDAHLAQDGEASAIREMVARIAALDVQYSRLAERLEARGGVLSDALDTAHRSMKNFWLAAEDTLGRLNAALARFDPPESTEKRAEDAERRDTQPVDDALGAIAERLHAIESRLDRGERDGARLRVALAELLARTARADATPPTRPIFAR